MSTTSNDATYWREYDNNSVSHSAAHYLTAVDSLRRQYGYARVTDVADMLEVSRGAASMALGQLKKRGWLAEDRNRFLLLTEDGERVARQIEHNFRILATLFQEVLGVSEEVAVADACKMEHLMSLETGRRMVRLMRYILGDKNRAKRVSKLMECYEPECEDAERCPLCDGEDCLAAPRGCTLNETDS